jgi:hypothetical protein
MDNEQRLGAILFTPPPPLRQKFPELLFFLKKGARASAAREISRL